MKSHSPKDELDMSKCSNCQGRGWYMGDTLVGDYDEITCEICNGTGKVDNAVVDYQESECDCEE